MNDATDGFPLDSAARVPFLPVAVTPRASTSRVIAEALRAAIVEGTLAPGAPLRQDAIARHFSVSAIPVREALRQLESEGWAKVAVNKGATVALLSAEEAREIYEIRSALESLAIGLAIPRHTAATLSEAEQLCRAAEAEMDPSLYVARNEAFHMSLYAPAARPQLEEMITTLHRRGERYLRLKFGLPLYKDESDREHAAILDAVRRGDIPAARSLVTEHLLGTGELLYRFLTERAQAEAAQANGRKPRAKRARTTPYRELNPPMNPRAEPSPHSASAPAARSWTTLRDEKARRLAAIAPWLEDGVLPAARIVDALETLIRPGDRVALEGDNQKQADFLSRSFAKVDPQKIHDVHLLISSISRPEHLTLFERGITRKVDFAFAGAQSLRVAQLLEDDQLEIGAIYTYVELYARMFVDLTPNVALLCADKADRHGNLYTGPNTEDTPTIAEAAAFRHGIVIVQVNEIVDELPRVDIPGSWVDVVVQADRPFAVEPLFTRDPRHIGDLQVLTAMMVIRGIYEAYGVTSLNHGIGFDTAAIELLLPTYGEALGLKGKICRNWTLNPHPTLIPAIESGWVESVHSFGSEVGMEQYIEARPDVFFTGSDGSLRSNRVLCQLAGQYGVDLFIGSTLQIDADANSSTVTRGRLAGFGGAPNMGHDPRGRRHPSEAWLKLLKDQGPVSRGQKLVVQLAETYKKGGEPTFVDELDAVAVGAKSGMPIAPVMIYGDDVSHVVTEEGIAHLHKAEGIDERRAAIAAVAGVTPIGLRAKPEKTAELRRRGIVAYPEDLGIRRGEAKRSLLAARSIDDLVTWSGGLYAPPARFRSW